MTTQMKHIHAIVYEINVINCRLNELADSSEEKETFNAIECKAIGNYLAK